MSHDTALLTCSKSIVSLSILSLESRVCHVINISGQSHVAKSYLKHPILYCYEQIMWWEFRDLRLMNWCCPSVCSSISNHFDICLKKNTLNVPASICVNLYILTFKLGFVTLSFNLGSKVTDSFHPDGLTLFDGFFTVFNEITNIWINTAQC